MLRSADFKPVYASGENEPIECYLNGLLNSIQFDLALGFFSSSGINVLALGFASFIKNGGKVRIAMNNYLGFQDKEAWENATIHFNIEELILRDLNTLYLSLSKYDEHFFKCLSWLIRSKRISLKAVKPKGNSLGIAHPKFGLFKDNTGSEVAFSGSTNFSRTALKYNLEAMSCYRSWETSDVSRLNYYRELFEKIWNDKYPFVTTVPLNEVKSFITGHFEALDLSELVEEEEHLINKALEKYPGLSLMANSERKMLTTTATSVVPPRDVKIRDYQRHAFEEWIHNGKRGIFAMATGTGKTITALNCIYLELKDKKFHHVLILVPTQDLLLQWVGQVERWGFHGVFTVTSNSDWKKDLTRFANDLSFGINSNFVIISTYRSFTNTVFQRILRKLPNDTILIADEAHNLGQQSVKLLLDSFPLKYRIGLTATPKRIYDPIGSDEIEKFFNDREPYCFSFYMEQAISEGFLCKYDYYPILVNLAEDELDEYINLSKKIARTSFLAPRSLDTDSPYQKLLLKRKRLINKARNKVAALRFIVKDIKSQGSLKFCFTYAPPGDTSYDSADSENGRIIREMQRVIQEEAPNVRSHAYLGETSNRADILKGFENGDIDVLLAINCLDEGVDIPRTEIGIFTSSTGNPRQFIQRRGRLLRNHPDKEKAQIYDMIVIPKIFGEAESKEFFEIERRLVKNELMRVGYFAKVSSNFYDSKDSLQEISQFYQLDLDTIIKELGQ